MGTTVYMERAVRFLGFCSKQVGRTKTENE